MKAKVQLEKSLVNLLGKDVTINGTVVGKVTEYDVQTGLATVLVNHESFSKIDWSPIARISSRKIHTI